MIINIAKVDALIKEVALTEIMPRFRNLGTDDVEIKRDKSSVTVADKAAEKALIALLQDYHPGSVIVGEESFEKSPEILSRFSGDQDVWVIDPIDGTINFINGKPEFGVIISLVRRKQAVAAWIHDPNTGDTLSAELGGGVWLRGHKMRLAQRESEVALGGILGWEMHKNFLRMKESGATGSLPEVDRGSASSFDYPRLFTGDALFANSVASRVSFLLGEDTKPWDHVAGLLMLAETKGISADFGGKAYNMESVAKRGLISTMDAPSWDRIRQTFSPAIDALSGF